jgi:hypothetical protein
MSPAQAVTAPEEQGSNPHSHSQAEQSENGVSISPGKSQNCSPWASKKDKSAYHCAHTQQESGEGTRAGPWLEIIHQ